MRCRTYSVVRLSECELYSEKFVFFGIFFKLILGETPSLLFLLIELGTFTILLLSEKLATYYYKSSVLLSSCRMLMCLSTYISMASVSSIMRAQIWSESSNSGSTCARRDNRCKSCSLNTMSPWLGASMPKFSSGINSESTIYFNSIALLCCYLNAEVYNLASPLSPIREFPVDFVYLAACWGGLIKNKMSWAKVRHWSLDVRVLPNWINVIMSAVE